MSDGRHFQANESQEVVASDTDRCMPRSEKIDESRPPDRLASISAWLTLAERTHPAKLLEAEREGGEA